MPTYDAECETCNYTYEYVQTMDMRNHVPRCPVCGKIGHKAVGLPPVVRPDLNDWSSENKGKGRFNKQLMTYCKDRSDAIDKAKAKGWAVLDKM